MIDPGPESRADKAASWIVIVSPGAILSFYDHELLSLY
jgi:hypothetical protein